MEYKTIARRCEARFIEKKSEFIGYLCPVRTEEQAVAFIEEIRAMHRKATHNCYAYILRENNAARHSDDGEPGGTAGVPIYEVLRKEGLTDVCCVVTRYFGGVLLGAGGLVRAYSQGAAAAINACGVGVMHPTARYLMEIPYAMLNRMDYFLKGEPVIVEDKTYTDVITYTLIMRSADEAGFLARLTNMSEGKLAPVRIEEIMLPWPEAQQ